MPKVAKFAFDLGDAVLIPNPTLLQGRVSARVDMMGRENEYHVHFLNPDLSLAHIVCGEASLVEAQPAVMKTKGRKR